MNNKDDLIKKIIAESLEIDEEIIKPSSRITEDLGADSMDKFELVHDISEGTGIDLQEGVDAKWTTVQDIYNYMEKLS